MEILRRNHIPLISERFELTLSTKPDPLKFFEKYDLAINPWGDYDDFLPKKNRCSYTGREVQVPVTRHFQRIKIETEGIDHWQNLLNELTKYGNIPNGLWIEAYMTRRDVARYHETVFLGIADNSWTYRFGKSLKKCMTFFPCIGGGQEGWWRETLINPYLSRPFSHETTFSHIKEWLMEVGE